MNNAPKGSQQQSPETAGEQVDRTEQSGFNPMRLLWQWREKVSQIRLYPRVPLDTITTRFLMIFIFLLAVPIVSVIVFTFSLLQNESQENGHLQIHMLHDAFWSQLTQKERFSQTLASSIQASSEKICSNLMNSRHMVRCVDAEVLPPEAAYRWHKGTLWFLAPLPHPNNEMNAVGFPVDKRLLNRFYQSMPSIWGEISLVPTVNDPKAQALYTDGLKRFHPENWLSADWLNQWMDHMAIQVRLGEKADYWLWQRHLYDASGQRIAHLSFWIPSVLQVKLQRYYLGIYILSVISVLLAVILAMIAGRPITQPLLRLIEQMNAIHHGNIGSLQATRLSNIHGVYEINQLTQSFNSLLQRLQHAHSMRDEFVATLTHDLKVPMLAEKQTLRYLLSGSYGPVNEIQQEVLGVMEATNGEVLTLVNGLLEVYRYESGGARLNMDTWDMRQLLLDTMAALRPLANEKKIRLGLKSNLPENTKVPVYGDALELKRVFHNLINNAITNTPAHGQIICQIETAASLGRTLLSRISQFQRSTLSHPVILKGRVLVSIQDSGIGFETEDLPRLFQQFSARKGRNPMSTGLGLFNCYQVVEAHHGQLWVETTEGEGAAVSFVIPQSPNIGSNRRKQERRFANPAEQPDADDTPDVSAGA